MQGTFSGFRSNSTQGSCRLRPPRSLSSGKLVIKDHHEHIELRARHILIEDGGELHAGSALCPFEGNFSIVLYGRWDDLTRGSNTALGADGKEVFPWRGRGGVWTSRADRNHRCVPLDCNREQDRCEVVKRVSIVVWMERG